jgi:hypothetical protein
MNLVLWLNCLLIPLNIADELNINFNTLKRWMDKAAMESSEIPPKRLKNWQLEDKLDALHKTYGRHSAPPSLRI